MGERSGIMTGRTRGGCKRKRKEIGIHPHRICPLRHVSRGCAYDRRDRAWSTDLDEVSWRHPDVDDMSQLWLRARLTQTHQPVLRRAMQNNNDRTIMGATLLMRLDGGPNTQGCEGAVLGHAPCVAFFSKFLTTFVLLYRIYRR